MEATLYNIDENFSAAVDAAVYAYNKGHVFVYPTDTIYGFGLNPLNASSLERLDTIKQRDPSKHYIMLIDDFSAIKSYVQLVKPEHEMFLNGLWRAPVSVVLNLNEKGKSLFGTDTLGLRAPDHPFCIALLERIHAPLVSTSVNRSSNPPLNDKQSILKEFGDEVESIFYKETLSTSINSTVISLMVEKPKLLREGEVSYEEILRKYDYFITTI